MRKRAQVQNVAWEYTQTPEAEARIKAAYDLLWSYPQETKLTENLPLATMPHDAPD